MSLVIRGMGLATPPHYVAQADAATAAADFCTAAASRKLLPRIHRGSEIERRASVLLEASSDTGIRQSFFSPARDAADRGPTTAMRNARYADAAPPLAIQAAAAALAQSALPPRAITHLITVSCTGFNAPGVDRALITALDLRPTIERTHVGFMGCHGALNGLRVADAFARAAPAARILLTAVELCSVHYQYGDDPQTLVSNALFADGAAALVGAAGEADPGGWRVAACGSCLLPDSADAMSWRIGDHGFAMTLALRVPELIAASLRPWLAEWLAQSNLRIADVGAWAVHPGGPRILSAVQQALGLADEALAASRAVLAEHGNMSSPTVLFILDRLRQAGAPRPCVAMAFGRGLVAEAVLLR